MSLKFILIFLISVGSVLKGGSFEAHDLISYSPAILAEVSSVREQFDNEVQQFAQDIETTDGKILRDRILTLINKYAKKCPIFLLDECTTEDGGACLLSRLYQPAVRENFESDVVNALVEKSESNQPVQYASFASGGMFQDLMILTKTLSKKPAATIDIHVIDINYAPYVCCRDLLQNTRKISVNHRTNPEPVMPQLMEQAKAKATDIKGMPDETLKKYLALMAFSMEAPAQQLLSYLETRFPQARLSLHIHDTVDNYLDYLSKQNIPYPDVISTADIEDEISLINGSVASYRKLFLKTLQEKPVSKNFWLGKDYRTSKAHIHSFSLDKQEKAKEVILEDGDKGTVLFSTSKDVRSDMKKILQNSPSVAKSKRYLSTTGKWILQHKTILLLAVTCAGMLYCKSKISSFNNRILLNS